MLSHRAQLFECRAPAQYGVLPDTVIRLKIREVAQAKKMSRTRLSRLADTNYKTINALWNDPYREVTTTTLDKIAKALAVPVTDLLEQVPDEGKET